MFVTWVFAGLLAGLLAGVVLKRGGYGLKKDLMPRLIGGIGATWAFRARAVLPDAGLVVAAVVAFIGASVLIVAQRKIRPTERLGTEKADMGWRWGLGVALGAVVARTTLGPAPLAAAVIEDKTYAVTRPAMKVKAGIVTGEVTGMKVAERVEQGSGRVVAAAKLTAIVTLKNSSTDQAVRLIGGKILYVDAQGQPITLEEAWTGPTLKLFTYGSSDRLDPGQETNFLAFNASAGKSTSSAW